MSQHACKYQDDREMAHAQWQAAVRRLRLLVEHADEFTPSVFVKKVDESLRELRKAAMRTISDENEE
jgi:glycyl-tRNA synthetase beta subunit